MRDYEDLIICDLAETYHIYNWRSLPLTLVATLVLGLRDNSRLKLKLHKQRASNTEILLATIADRLALIFSEEGTIPPLLTPELFEDFVKKDDDTEKYDSIDDYEKARKELLNKAKGGK